MALAPDRSPGPGAPLARRGPARYEIELSDEVVAWYARLGTRDRAVADRALDRLAARGPAVAMPHARPLGEGLFELRFVCEGVARRITYAFGRGHEVHALTTFRKQRAVERHEVERAVRAAGRAAREREAGRGVGR